MPKNIKIYWTCSNYKDHQHRWRWSAWLCGRWQRFTSLIVMVLMIGCASVKAPKTHVMKVENQIDMRMTLSQLEDLRPVVYYKSKTFGIEFYETQHLTQFGEIPFLTKQTTAYKDTIRAMPCYFRVRASNDGKRWSGWSKSILIK